MARVRRTVHQGHSRRMRFHACRRQHGVGHVCLRWSVRKLGVTCQRGLERLLLLLLLTSLDLGIRSLDLGLVNELLLELLDCEAYLVVDLFKIHSSTRNQEPARLADQLPCHQSLRTFAAVGTVREMHQVGSERLPAPLGAWSAS